MQLLSTLTMVILTIYNVRLIKQAWAWTWVLAASSTLCAVVAIPLYLTILTEWSVAISFAGSVAQAFVTLQLMFSI